MNKAELVRLTAGRHFMETKHNSEYLQMQGPDCAMRERLLKERESKDVVVRMSHDQTDLRIYQGRIISNLGRIKNKIDHLTIMTEGEIRHGLREQKLEYERQQQGQKKPIKIKRSKSRKHRYQLGPRKFNGPNHKSRGQRNIHSCEKASCKYSMEEFKYNQDGFAEHLPYDEFLRVASQQKASKDRLDGLCRLRKTEEPRRIL